MLGIRIMCPNAAVCLLADCCFSELAYLTSNLTQICPVSTQHERVRPLTGIARNRNVVSEWSGMSTRGLLFQWASIINIQHSVLIQYKAGVIIISTRCNFFSPRYSWKISHLALHNNHSVTFYRIYGLYSMSWIVCI